MSTLVRAGMTPAERCRYVADLIEAHPENFDMYWYFGEVRPEEGLDDYGEPVRKDREFDALSDGWRPDLRTTCGTVACIAGWAVAVTPPGEIDAATCWDVDHAAAPLLGLDLGAGEDLFYSTYLSAPEAAFLLRWHADELDRA